MARRTIHARRASPYLLYLMIAFIVLAVAGWVLWGWTFSARNEIQRDTLGMTRINQAADSGRDPMKELLNKYKDEGPNLADILEAKTKLADAYAVEIQRLTFSLIGEEYKGQRGDILRGSVSDAVNQTTQLLSEAKEGAEKSYADVKDQPTTVQIASMKDAVTVLQRRIGELVGRVGQVEGAKAGVDTELATAKGELEAVKTQHEQEMAQKDANYAKEKTDLTTARDDAVKSQGQLSEQLQRLQDRMIAKDRENRTQKDALDRKVTEQVNTINELRKRIEGFIKLPTESAVDGRIISVGESGAVAYGDLGKDDGILMGMTFSIFSPSELGKDEAAPKGSARVVKILDHSCEMRVFQAAGQDPVVVNDLLHNPIYDRQRRLHFVLAGRMYVDDDTEDDTEALKAMIQKFGGKVDANVSLQTDYLVLGEEPRPLASPATDATPEERQAYEVARKAFLDFSAAKAQADDFSIPILSLNRFLGLAGMAGRQ